MKYSLSGFIFILFLCMLFGCGGGAGGEVQVHCSQTEKTVTREPVRLTPEILPDGRCASYVEGPPVGISCLHCLQPQAREQARHLADVMGGSCRRNLSTMVLADGSFGDDPVFFNEIIDRITRGGSTLHLYVYLANGPWQKNILTFPQLGFPAGITPEDFRVRIHSDSELRETYRSLIGRLESTFRFARERGVVLYLLPMLEDNLDAASARALESLVRESVPADIEYALGRNPCPGCYPGNDESIPDGLFRDQHVSSSCHRVSVFNGLASNDGGDFHFPGESGAGDLAFEELFAFAEEAAARSTSFILWRGDYQGRPSVDDVVPPAARNYVVPSEEQNLLLLEFLQTAYL